MTKANQQARRKLRIYCLIWFVFGAAISNYATIMIFITTSKCAT